MQSNMLDSGDIEGKYDTPTLLSKELATQWGNKMLWK